MRPVAVLMLTILAATLPAAAVPASAEEVADVRPLRLADGRPWPADAVCYGPHRDGQHPGGPSPSAAELREDLDLMLPHWKLLRTYGASGFAGTLLELIRDGDLGMKVVLGAWVDADDAEANDRESAAAIALANAYPDVVVAVCVGNETRVDWSAHRCPPDTLLRQVRRVRSAVDVPVTTADDFKYWVLPESRAIAAELDFVMMHAHPLWNGRQLDEALGWLAAQVDSVQALHADRPVVVGETGWATSYLDEGEQGELIRGRAGEAEQKRFLAEVRAWAAHRRLPVFWFEAFDENWKGGDHPDEVEKHWGLYRADRTPKAALADGPAR